MSDRQTGTTTRQMTEAPVSAIFVWCNNRTKNYAEPLAKKLGRDDLTVRPLSWLQVRNVIGRDFAEIVVDHAAQLGKNGLEALHYIRTRCVASAG